MVVGYAGMMTEDLEPRMRDIPDVSNFPKNEIIIQKSHRYPFDHQIRQTGAKLVEVETREEMIAAINPKRLRFISRTSCLTKARSVVPKLSRSPKRTTSIRLTMPLPMFREGAALGVCGPGLRHGGLQRR